jgi:hypothetical protein
MRNLAVLLAALGVCLSASLALAQGTVPNGVGAAAPAAPPTQPGNYKLVMVTFVNNGNPSGLTATAQTVLGKYSTLDACTAAARGARSNVLPPVGSYNAATDMLRLYTVCIASP